MRSRPLVVATRTSRLKHQHDTCVRLLSGQFKDTELTAETSTQHVCEAIVWSVKDKELTAETSTQHVCEAIVWSVKDTDLHG